MQREYVLAVQILVQAVVVAGAVAQQQRGRPRLTGGMTARQECLVPRRIDDVDVHRLVPAIRQRHQTRVQRRAQRLDVVWQRVTEVLVFAAAEAVPRHDDAAAMPRVVVVEPGERLAFLRGQQPRQDRAAAGVEVLRDPVPVERSDALDDAGFARSCDGGREPCVHALASRSSSARLRSAPQR